MNTPRESSDALPTVQEALAQLGKQAHDLVKVLADIDDSFVQGEEWAEALLEALRMKGIVRLDEGRSLHIRIVFKKKEPSLVVLQTMEHGAGDSKRVPLRSIIYVPNSDEAAKLSYVASSAPLFSVTLTERDLRLDSINGKLLEEEDAPTTLAAVEQETRDSMNAHFEELFDDEQDPAAPPAACTYEYEGLPESMGHASGLIADAIQLLRAQKPTED